MGVLFRLGQGNISVVSKGGTPVGKGWMNEGSYVEAHPKTAAVAIVVLALLAIF
jgi:hypothetical protein